MAYLHIKTKQAFSAQEIIANHPEVNFPDGAWSDEMLADYGYAELWIPTEHPVPKKHERLEETTPKKIDGKWYKQYIVTQTIPTDPVGIETFIAKEKQSLKAQVTHIRYMTEVNGVYYGDVLIPTDRDSQAKLTSAITLSQLTPGLTISWKCANNSWIQLNTEELQGIGVLVGQHIQKAFKNEEMHHSAIDSLSQLEDVLAYDVYAKLA